MEFLLMRLEGDGIMPDSIFGVLANGNRGRLPPRQGPLVGIQHSVRARLQVCCRRKTGDHKRGIFSRRFGCYRRVGATSSWRAWKEIQAVVTRNMTNALIGLGDRVGPGGAHLSARVSPVVHSFLGFVTALPTLQVVIHTIWR